MFGPVPRALDQPGESETEATAIDPSGGFARIRFRAVAIAIVLTFLCGIWVRQAEIVVLSTQITESVPAIPALAVLFLLVLINPLLRRLGERFALNRAELLVIYSFVVISLS